MAKPNQQNLATGWKANQEFKKIIEENTANEVVSYIKSPAFTEKDYIDCMAGMYADYGLNPHDAFYSTGKKAREAMQKTPFNKVGINEKAIDFAYDVKKLKEDWNSKNPKNLIDLSDDASNIKNIARYWDLSTKAINKLVSDPKYMLHNDYSNKVEPLSEVLKNPKVKTEHLHKYLQSHPEHVDDILGHEAMDSNLENQIFENPEHIKHMSNSKLERRLASKMKYLDQADGSIQKKMDLSPKAAKAIAEHGSDKIFNSTLDETLGAMDPADKKDLIDRKMGIAGGERAGLSSWRTPEPVADDNWDDWTPGPEHDAKFMNRISASPHLSDDQAEHIKRHGDFESKYNLYHNKDVDPKHGVEMFKMWHDNEEDKGYNSQQLTDRYKQKKQDIYSLDDLDPDLIDDDELMDVADEGASENYPFSEWVDDNKNEVMESMESDPDSVDEYLGDQNHDWTAENPDYDKDLDQLHQAVIDGGESEGNNHTHVDSIPKLTGGKTAEDLGIDHLADGDGNIDHDSLVSHTEETNPQEIDYANHPEKHISEHPDYDDRYSDAEARYKDAKINEDPHAFYDDHYEDWMQSDAYNEAREAALSDARDSAAQPHYKELYQSSHQDDRFIPEHLHSHIPNMDQIKANRSKAGSEPVAFLNEHAPKRSYEHSYGDDQHLHELLKDYSDANGGSIDIGRMHKLMPNQGDSWKKIFGPKGKLTSEEIQQKTDAIPKTKYDISYGKWAGDKMQNINRRDQMIFRLDHSDESLKPLQEDPALFQTFKKVQEVSKRSGHPTKDRTIAWARVDTSDPEHWMIDEVQSDFGKTIRDYLTKEGNEDKASHVQKISDYHKDWRENLMNHVIGEAKKHGVSKISTHSPESKASHTGAGKAHSVYQDSYKKVPRKMGFKPSQAHELPLANGVKENVFRKDKSEEPGLNPKTAHIDAWNEHKSWAGAYNQLADTWSDNPILPQVQEYAAHHEKMADSHRQKALAAGAEHNDVSVFPVAPAGTSQLKTASKHLVENTKYEHPQDGALNQPAPKVEEPKYHEGHTLNLKPNLVKAMLDIVEDLVKFEIILNNSSNKEIIDRANRSIRLIKGILGHDPDLSKWEARRKMMANDLAKAVNTPAKTIGLNRLKQIQADHGMGAGGQEYNTDELKTAINERGNAQAQKAVVGAKRQEKQMAQQASDQAQGIGGLAPGSVPPMPGKLKPLVKPTANIRDVANSYAQSKGLSLNHNIPKSKVDPNHSAKIASEYEKAIHNPQDSRVKTAYDSLIKETGEQFKHMLGTGLKISKIKPGQENPYKTSKDLFSDIKNNNHISYFPTEQGFGSGDQNADHPMLQPTEHMHEGKPMLANDVFRIVHDYFGHAKEENGFGPNGEEDAWKHHMQMYSPMAQKALTSETRGQNSWVNFGPHGESNRANPANTKYADQKATIMPDWTLNHEHQSSASKIAKSEIVSGKHLKRLSTLMKAKQPKQIELQTGANKGRIVDVVRNNPKESDYGVKPRLGSKPLLVGKTGGGHKTGSENETLGWDRNRKHNVIAETSKRSESLPPSSSGSSGSSGSEGGFELKDSDKGVLTSAHAHREIPHSPAQKDLIHGIDLGKVKQGNKGWTSSMALSGVGKNAQKKNVIVKGHLDKDEGYLGDAYHPRSGLSSSQREALYHNLAHGPFGMGKYVPTTGVAEHKGTHYSVMEVIPKAEHYNENSRKHRNVLHDARQNGDIQKLAIMNMIMGNSDRHGGNYMISPKGLHMIDHGLTFNYNKNNRDIFRPDYLDHAYPELGPVDLHPEAIKWLKGLDSKQFQAHLKAHGIDPQFKKSILGALQSAKKGIKYGRLKDLLQTITNYHNDNIHED